MIQNHPREISLKEKSQKSIIKRKKTVTNSIKSEEKRREVETDLKEEDSEAEEVVPEVAIMEVMKDKIKKKGKSTRRNSPRNTKNTRNIRNTENQEEKRVQRKISKRTISTNQRRKNNNQNQ